MVRTLSRTQSVPYCVISMEIYSLHISSGSYTYPIVPILLKGGKTNYCCYFSLTHGNTVPDVVCNLPENKDSGSSSICYHLSKSIL